MAADARGARDWRAALWLTAGLTLARLVVLFRTPLELYPDEAQYWLWSRALDFGYFSKPPVVAWAIRITTAVGGDAEPWVRLSAPLFQAGATLCAFAVGRRLYGPAAGLAAAALYALCPAVQLSALVIATDAPLLFFLGLALGAYVALPGAAGGRRLLLSAGFGAALGAAFLSKYAAAYFLAGLALHLALVREARRAWSPASALLAAVSALAVLAPNLAWNAAHGFATLQHTALAADWRRGELFRPAALGGFLLEQMLIFGPIPAAALVVGAALALRRRALSAPDLLLACFALPPLLIVAAQAFISRANANWTGAAYLPAAVLAGAWFVRWRARRWFAAAVALQALGAAAFLCLCAAPALADAVGAANSFKRVRGWREVTAQVVARAREELAGPGLSAVAVDNRFLYYALAYYGRGFFAQPDGTPLRAWLPEGRPQNQAELSAPLIPAFGGRVLIASYEGWRAADVRGDFAVASLSEIVSIRLDGRRRRRIELFIGEQLRPNGSATPP